MSIPIYYINLDRSTERNNIMINSFNKLNTKYQRVPAIDMLNISRESYSKGSVNNMTYTIRQNKIYNPKAKEIAIILSHFKALQEMIINKDEIAIILEDDISFKYITDWNKQIDEIIQNCPSDWNIIKLHSSLKTRIEKNIMLCRSGILYDKLDNKELQSAGCYIIKKNTAINLMSNYFVNNMYSFPYKNEYCVCECIIFSVPNVYMYTQPIICAIENNITCCGNHNIADIQSNKLINGYWNHNFSNNLLINQTKKIKVISIREAKLT